ncbi:molybdenum cofactor guanylyltransferase [Myxococcota bacterium]|nr:molybdenum cofactor guanylyltransferase [Myxococcota bacterium]
MKTAVVILCGGESRRMGRPKALLPWRGTSIISYIVERFRALVDEVLVVSSSSLTLPVLSSAEIVIDEADHQGPLAGIARGLEAMEADFAFVIATDMPFVSRQFVDILLSREIPVAMELGGIVQTLAAVYPKEGATVARSLLRSGRARPYDLLKKMGAEIVKETDLTFNPGLDGMNTPEDYLEAISKDDPDAKATVEFFGRIRLLTGMRLQTLPISTLGKLLELAAPDIRWIENDILGREFLISLNGGEFVRNVHMPVGPEESVIVLDAPAGG